MSDDVQRGVSWRVMEHVLQTASQQFRPEDLAARRQREAAAQLQHGVASQIAASAPDSLRREALTLAIDAMQKGARDVRPEDIVAAAKAFEAYLRGDHYADSPDTVAVSRAISR